MSVSSAPSSSSSALSASFSSGSYKRQKKHGLSKVIKYQHNKLQDCKQWPQEIIKNNTVIYSLSKVI